MPHSQQQCIGLVRTALPAKFVIADQKRVTVVPTKSTVHLQAHDGSCLHNVTIGDVGDSQQYLLLALGRLVSRDGALVTGSVRQAPGHWDVVLNVHVPLRLWQGTSAWKGSNAAAIVFSEIQCDSQGSADLIPLADIRTADQYSLSSCFSELPSYAQEPSPTPDGVPVVQTIHAHGVSRLEALPDYILSQVLSQLNHRDLAAASSTCRALQQQALQTVPGLRLHLYPHQSRALQWMLAREQEIKEVENPCWRGLVSSGGLPCWVCIATGSFALDPPAPLQDCRGGLFCDEPGLGKTITGLALISKTRGNLPTPPAGPGGSPVKCTWVKDPAGKPAAFYTVANGGVPSPTKPLGATRSSRRASSCGTQLASRSSQPLHQSQQDAQMESGTASKWQKKDPSAPGLTGSSMTDKRQTRQASKGEEGTLEQPVQTGLQGKEGNAERLKGQQQLPTDNSQAVEQASAPAVADANYVWVQCDLCNKWRELPKGHKVCEDADWVCAMHPFSSMRSCAEPEDTTILHAFADCPGFIKHDESFGSEKNVAHFQKLLQGFGNLVKDTTSAAWWLVKQSPQVIHDGVAVPAGHRKAAGWDDFFKELGLVPTDRPAPKSPKGYAPTEVSAPGRGIKRKKSTSKPKGCWKQPWQIDSLLLDTQALLTALQTGPAKEEQKVYLSSATLLVLPPTLIPHWLHQIRVHMKPGTLRVAVLSGDRGSSDDSSLGVTYWGLGRAQPPVHELAWGYDLVLTTFTRLSADWSHSSASSPLKQVHWLRVILDEGHMLGASLTITNKLQMACALKAERRWVMSGTPTPSTPTSHVAHLQPLLAFLRQQPYGLHRKTWEDAVQKPFEARQRAGRARLMALLSRIMIRAAKSDLVTIPPCHHKVTMLDFAPEHAHSYNELIEVVKLNLLLADWNDEDHNESLLSVRNSKWGKEMLRNVRLSCCVAGNCDLAVKETDVQETLELLGERLGYEPPGAHWAPWVPPTHPLAYVENALRDGGTCQLCGAVARLLVVAPCAHLFCLDCVSMDRQACPSCHKPYQMQSVSDPARLENNPNPKWDVPMDVIEWQCSYTQKGALGLSGGAWSANWQITKSTKCVHLLRRLMDIGAAPKGPAQEEVRQVSKGLTKAIVFSQFWMHIQLISSHLRAHGIALSVLKQDMSPKDKAAAVATFQRDPNVGVLLMDETGSVGLDLSFVSWVFLMEPLADASLQAQVTARAHRMGASQAIHVETLVMKGTAEEQMLSLNSIPSALDASAAPSGRASPPSSTSLPHTATCAISLAMPASQQGGANIAHCEPENSAAPQQGFCPLKSMTSAVKMKDQMAGVIQLQGAQEVHPLRSTADLRSVQGSAEQQMLTPTAVDSQQQSEARTAVNEGGQALESPEKAPGTEVVRSAALASGALPSGPSRASPAASPSGAGVVNAAQGRERTEAARRGTRNSLLSSLHRVVIAELAEFQDLPIDEVTQSGKADALAAMDVT